MQKAKNARRGDEANLEADTLEVDLLCVGRRRTLLASMFPCINDSSRGRLAAVGIWVELLRELGNFMESLFV